MLLSDVFSSGVCCGLNTSLRAVAELHIALFHAPVWLRNGAGALRWEASQSVSHCNAAMGVVSVWARLAGGPEDPNVLR